MAIIPELINARPSSSFVGAPIEEFKELGATLQNRFEQNRASLGQFDSILENLDVRDVNRPAVNHEVSNFKNRINEFVDRGDFENISNDVFKMARDFQNNKIIGEAVKDKKQFSVWKDNVETLFKEGKIDHQTYQDTLEYSSARNNKPIEIDPETGTVSNIFSGYTPAEYQDIGQAMLDKSNDWKSNEKPVTVKYKDGKGNEVESQIIFDPKSQGFIFTGTNESVSDDELRSALTTAVMSDPKYMSYINQNLRFQKDKMFRARGIEEVTENDLTKIMGIDSEELKKQVEEAGYKYETMIADPEMRESLYDIFYRNKAIDGYVSPAVAKEGFSKTTTKLYDNKVYLEQLRHAHNLKLQRQKAADERDLELLKNQLEKPLAKSYIDSQPGTLIDSPFKLTEFPNRIKDIDQTVGKLEQKRRDGEIDYASATQEIEALKKEKAVLSTYNKVSKTQYLETSEGQKYLDNIYNDYLKWTRNSIEPKKSKEFFKEQLLADDVDKSNFVFKQRDNSHRDISSWFINEASRGLSNKVEDFQKDNNVAQSSFANVLSGTGDTSGKDANSVDIFNKGLKISLNEHSKNYLAWTPSGLKDFNEIKKGYDAEKVEINPGVYDSPIYDNWYYQADVVDKKTGKVLDTYSVMPKDQKSAQQNYWDLNWQLWQERGENDAIGKKAKQTLAHIKFPNLSTRDLNIELSGIDDDSELNTTDYSSVKRIGNQNYVVSKTKMEIPVIGEPGRTASRLVYQLIRVDDGISQGTEVDGNKINEIRHIDENGKDTKLFNPELVTNPEAVSKGMVNDFFSIEDIKSVLFDKTLNNNGTR